MEEVQSVQSNITSDHEEGDHENQNVWGESGDAPVNHNEVEPDPVTYVDQFLEDCKLVKWLYSFFQVRFECQQHVGHAAHQHEQKSHDLEDVWAVVVLVECHL